MEQEQRLYYLQKMGIQTWAYKQPVVSPDLASSLEVKTIDALVSDTGVEAIYDWDGLGLAISNCQRCAQSSERQNALIGYGAQQAECLVISEAPNLEEDKEGRPFVGEAGVLLTAMLKSIGVIQEQVYLTNIVKCKPNENQKLDQACIDNCQSYLHQQISLINPKLILLLGRVAAHALLNCNSDMSELRGRVHEFSLGDKVFPVVVSYHPAYLLRKPSQKKLVWDDMLLLQEQIN